MLVRELNAQQVCMLAFIVSNKVCIVTIIASDISSVILINITVGIPKSVHKIIVDTYRIMIKVYVKISSC